MNKLTQPKSGSLSMWIHEKEFYISKPSKGQKYDSDEQEEEKQK